MTENNRTYWTCRECGFPIADNYGAIVALYDDINNPPEHGIPWTPWHYTCQPVEGYAIDVQSLRSAGQFAWWTRHLLGKSWIVDSTWRDVASMFCQGVEVPL